MWHSCPSNVSFGLIAVRRDFKELLAMLTAAV
jgi:hypothetical protein